MPSNDNMTVPRSEARPQGEATASDERTDQAPGANVGQDPVADPFPNRGMLGKPRGDPLDPSEYVVTFEAADGVARGTYRLDVDGTVHSRPADATVTEGGERVSGELSRGESAQVVFRGLLTWIETDESVDLTIRVRD